MKERFRPILTDRLILRPLEPADAPALFAYRSDPEITRYQEWETQTIEEVVAFIERQQTTVPNTPGQWFQLGIVERDSGALVGDCGIHTPLDEPRQAELGITLAPAFHRRSFATEALRAILGHLFGALGKHGVFASVDPRNAPSMKLVRSLRMREEAHFVQSIWFKGAWADDVVFAMLATEWAEMKKA